MDEQYIIDLKVKTPGVVPATKKIKALEEEMAKLEKTSESYKQKQIEVARVQNASGDSSKKLGTTVDGAKGSIGGLTKGLSLATVALTGTVAVAATLATGVVAIGVAALDSANEFKALEKQLKSTGASGATLKQLGNDAKFLKDNFNIDGTQFAESVNNLVANFGLTTEEAAAAIKEAAIAGGNATGDLTSLISEYSTQAAAGGKSATEFFDSIVNGAALGSFQQDKLLDASKELTLRYKENTKATADALKPLGDEFNKGLRKQFESGAINIDEVLLKIIDRTKELNLSQQETQTIIADLGGGALEDLGSLDRSYKLLTQSVGATNRATLALSATELEAIERSERKIAFQRELADGIGNQLIRLGNAITDSLLKAAEKLDFTGDKVEKLGDVLVDVVGDVGDLSTEVIRFVSNSEFLQSAVRGATILFGGLIDILPKAIALLKEYNDAKTPPPDTTVQDLTDNLDKQSKELEKFSVRAKGTVSRLKETLEKETANIASTRKGSFFEGITTEEAKKLKTDFDNRLKTIREGQKKIQQVNSQFEGRLSETDNAKVVAALFRYETSVNAAAEADEAIRNNQVAAAEKQLQLELQQFDKRKTVSSKGNKDLSDINKERIDKEIQDEQDKFNKLKKSFQDNFEGQRLEAQKDFLNGLISQEELAARIFAINQQENNVLISITANKKEAAKTGEEDLEISKLTVANLQLQSDELTRQLGIRNRLIEAEKNLRSSELDIRQSELKIEEESKIQEVITDVSIQSEEDRQKAIAKVRADFAVRERQLRIEALRQNVRDAQVELSTLNQGSTDTGTEEGIINSEKIANATKELIGYKAELAGLETQQIEAANSLDKTTDTTLDKLATKAELINGYIQQVAEGFKQAVQADIAATESSLNAQEARIQAGVELAKLGNDELLNQELERQDKLLEEREKAANKEKVIAAIQVAANLAVAIAKAAAEGGGIGSLATIATVLGAVGVGFASIGALVGGAFADGVIDFKGKGTERSDSNIVAISRGESVITAKGTKNASKMLTMINEGRLKDSDYLTAGLDLQPIQTATQVIDMRREMNEQIALASELLDEMRNFHTKIDFTDKGIEQFINTKNQRITKLNTR